MRQRNLQARTCSKPSDGQQIPTVNAKIASLRLAAHRKERAVRIDAALTSVLFRRRGLQVGLRPARSSYRHCHVDKSFLIIFRATIFLASLLSFLVTPALGQTADDKKPRRQG
jgi:hypothetical protein